MDNCSPVASQEPAGTGSQSVGEGKLASKKGGKLRDVNPVCELVWIAVVGLTSADRHYVDLVPAFAQAICQVAKMDA
jgi:hypothetical protein